MRISEVNMWKIVLILSGLLIACGGATNGAGSADGVGGDLESEFTADDLVERAVVTRADFTTSVDEKRFRATTPPATEYSSKERVIYLVGRLKRVPTDSTIEVHWFLDALPEPLLISDIQGSDRYQFIASFRPTDRKFIRGSYTARIVINGEEIDSRSFVIRDEAIEQDGPKVRKVAFSTKVSGKMKARRPTIQFVQDTKKVFVSFNVTGVDHGVAAEVEWSRGGEVFHSEDLTLAGDRRYAAHIESNMGLPSGEYEVRISILDGLRAKKTFKIGKDAAGPTVDTISLGLNLSANNMPVKPMTAFNRDTRVIQCGIKFLDLVPNTMIEIQWMKVEEDGDILKYTNRSALPAGGSGTMGAAWELTYVLMPGNYKVVVVIDGEVLGEEPFEIE